jgi:tetratricopeptide (TPR) repeat protein
MRKWVLLTAVAAGLPASPAWAADHLLFGPPPAWVVPVASPAPPAADDSSAFTTLLDNEQGMLEKGKRSYFSESIYRINSPQGLDDGNIKLTWDPESDTVTVHKLVIRRGDQVIDVLKSGQTFTTLRRETNLDAGMLDGQLTATLMPEGLQVGDIVELACTYVHADPATKDSSEIEIADFNGSPIERGFARLSWPSSLHVTFQTLGGLPAPKVTTKSGLSTIEYDLKDIQPLVLPEAAPPRFRTVRSLNASTFANWSEVAMLMKPYFDAASVIPASGPLRDEVEKIRALPGGDRGHAEAALKLVQDRIRYIALSMGTGGYVPANADVTWTRRFGDCKAKTALLLAILHELKIDAEAVLANTDGNDGLDQRQPRLGWFNHVLVRAHVDGKPYWLDGTRSGDSSLDRLETPAFDWGLPLLPKAALVRMVPEPYKQPNFEVALSIDARDGIYLPAPTTITYTFRGDTARKAKINYDQQAPSQRDRYLREFFKSVADDWKTSFISLTPEKVSEAYDPAKGEMRLSFAGTAKLDWSDSNFYVNFAALAYKPNFQRTEGVNREAPIAVDYPSYTRLTESIRLPEAFAQADWKIPDVDTTAVGVEYHRHASFADDTFTIETTERSIASEVPYAEAIAASSRLRELNSNQLSLNVPSSYRSSDKELTARLAEKLGTFGEYVDRGGALMDRGRYDEAIADYTAAIALDPKNAVAYSDRALSYIWKQDKAHARADLDAAAALDPKEPTMLRARGLLAEDEAKWQDAAEAYTASLVKDPGNGFALGHRAIAWASLKRDDEALSDAAAALEISPGWYELHRIRAAIFIKRHQCTDAGKDAEAIVDHSSSDQSALVAAARLYVLCQQRDRGFATFDKALAIKPDATVYMNRALSRPAADRAARLADMDAAIKLEPKTADWLMYKGDELDQVGDKAGALKLYDDALKLQPDAFAVSVKRAVLAYQLGRTDEAQKQLTALRSRATNATMLNNLCWEKATAGILLDSALADCNAALKLRPDAAAYLDSLGMTLLRLGRYDEAISAYDKAIAAGTGAISLMGRSIAHARKGEKALADADRKAALADDPEISTRAQRYGLPF